MVNFQFESAANPDVGSPRRNAEVILHRGKQLIQAGNSAFAWSLSIMEYSDIKNSWALFHLNIFAIAQVRIAEIAGTKICASSSNKHVEILKKQKSANWETSNWEVTNLYKLNWSCCDFSVPNCKANDVCGYIWQ